MAVGRNEVRVEEGMVRKMGEKGVGRERPLLVVAVVVVGGNLPQIPASESETGAVGKGLAHLAAG